MEEGLKLAFNHKIYTCFHASLVSTNILEKSNIIFRGLKIIATVNIFKKFVIKLNLEFFVMLQCQCLSDVSYLPCKCT